MKTEMEITVHRVTVRRRTNGNLSIKVYEDGNELTRTLEITPEESENLQRALSMIELIAANV